MVRKYLIWGKQLFFSSKKPPDGLYGQATVLEILMPAEIYWALRDLVQKADYLLAAGQEQADIVTIHNQIGKKVAPFAVYEKDRQWLYQKFRPDHQIT